jgi:hypothetical protein
MRHLPFILCIVLGAAAVFIGYVGGLPAYGAWLVGVAGSFVAFVSCFAWLLISASERRRGLLSLSAGVVTVVGYLPLHVALSEELKAPDLYSIVTGNMEAVFFIVPSLVAGLAIFHGIRTLSEKRPNQPPQQQRP